MDLGKTIGVSMRICLMLAFASPILTTGQPASGADNAVKDSPQSVKKPPEARSGIGVSFRLDPRLTSGLYMGERWVSPPTYTMVQEGETCEIGARASGTGKLSKSIPKWIPSDPDMISVSPSEGKQVTITVKRAGESKLKIELAGASRELPVKATKYGDGIKVEITQ